MFTPRVVLEARDWLRRGNPRQAAAVLLPAREQRHRDLVDARQKVCAALIETARKELEQNELWAAWEAVELAHQLAPLVGDARVLREQLARQVQQRQARREWISEVVNKARRWLDGGQVREAIWLIEQFLPSEGNPAHSATDWKLQQIWKEAQVILQSLEQRVAEVRKLLEQGQFREAWQRCQQAPPQIAASPDLVSLRQQAAETLFRKRLSQAREAARAGDVEQARRCLASAFKYAEDQATLREELADVQAQIDQVERQQQEAARQADAQRRLSSLASAIERANLPAAYQRLRAACQAVPSDHPQLQQLLQRLTELEQQHASRPDQPRPVRNRDAQIVFNNLLLVLSRDEVVVGGRGGRRADLKLSAALAERHAMLVRGRKGYTLHLMAGENGELARVWVNDEPARHGQALRHDDRLVWEGASGAWRFRLPVPGSLTAMLVQEELDGSAALVTRGCCRQVLLLADEAVLAGQPGKGVHVVVPGLPGRLRLAWKPDGLMWEVEGAQLRGASDREVFGGLLCVPSEWVLEDVSSDGAMSEAEWLRQALRRRGMPQSVGLRWAWA
jgi:hypothetical protein